MALEDALLIEFCSNFAGYGNPKAGRWYVGMEEGGGHTEAEIAARIAAWGRRGKSRIEDLREFCQETGFASLVSWARIDAPKQKTWFGLIEDMARRENKSLSVAEMLHFQRTEWLSKESDTCLLDLMPLPSPGTSDEGWRYGLWTNIPQFRTRALYVRSLESSRIELVRGLLDQYRPKQVICVGKTYEKYWNQIADGFPDIEFLLIQHPAARGSNAATNASIVQSQKTEVVPRNVAWRDRLEAAIEHLAARERPHYYRIENVSNCEVYLGFIGGYGPDELCIEWKIPKSYVNASIPERITDGPPQYLATPEIIVGIGATAGQRAEWQPNGKGNSGNVAILCLLYADRADANETQDSWVRRIYPAFREAISVA